MRLNLIASVPSGAFRPNHTQIQFLAPAPPGTYGSQLTEAPAWQRQVVGIFRHELPERGSKTESHLVWWHGRLAGGTGSPRWLLAPYWELKAPLKVFAQAALNEINMYPLPVTCSSPSVLSIQVQSVGSPLSYLSPGLCPPPWHRAPYSFPITFLLDAWPLRKQPASFKDQSRYQLLASLAGQHFGLVFGAVDGTQGLSHPKYDLYPRATPHLPLFCSN